MNGTDDTETNGPSDASIQSDATQNAPISSVSAEASRNNEEIQCDVCGETYLRKNTNEHKTTIKHIEAQKEKFGEKFCDVCNEKYASGLWKEHTKTRPHILNYERKMRERDNVAIQCDVCGETHLVKHTNEHNATIRHTEAQRKKFGEELCNVCNEKYAKGFLKEHIKTESHILENERKIRKRDNEQVLCDVCGETHLVKHTNEHNATIRHIEAQRKKFGEELCNVCNEKYAKGFLKEHTKTEFHILENEKKIRKRDNEKVLCDVCGETHLVKHTNEHKTTIKHIEARKEKFGEELCDVCNEKYAVGLWEEHTKTGTHILNYKKKMQEKDNEDIQCYVCGETHLHKNTDEHKTTIKHIKAQKEKFGEKLCDVCNEKYAVGLWQEHIKTGTHILNYNKKMQEKDNEEIQCYVCGETHLHKYTDEHKATIKHTEAQKEKFGEKLCEVCNEKYAKGLWKEHTKIKIHILENERKIRQRDDEEIQCYICGETHLPKSTIKHKASPKHIEAQKQKFGEELCEVCNEKYAKGLWKEHTKTKTHISNYKKKMQEKDNEDIQCYVCGETHLRKDTDEHKATIKHIEAQKEKFGEELCDVCNEKYAVGLWKEHTKTKTHILNYKKKMQERDDEEVQCYICGETHLRKSTMEHKASTKHIEAQKEKFGEELCDVCNEKYAIGFWIEHARTKTHILNYERKIREKGDEEIECKVCKEKYLRRNMNEHLATIKHIEAQKEKYGEIECNVCKEKYVKGLWRQHAKTETHTLIAQQKQQIQKDVVSQPKVESERELYILREASEENKKYINTLTAFFAVRHALKTKENFTISVNDNRWNDFGDIVIEIFGSKGTKIEAIRCKKVETKSNYTTRVFGAESGKLSLKEQCEILENLSQTNSKEYFTNIENLLRKEKLGQLTEEDKQSLNNTSENFIKLKNLLEREQEGNLTKDEIVYLKEMRQDRNFKLFTVSSVSLDHNPQYSYNDEVVKDWKNLESIELWKDRDVEIKQSKDKNKDLFNTTDDRDNIFTFQVLNHKDESLNNNLQKFHLYINQKRGFDLQAAITTMIEDEFGVPVDISDDLIKYIRKKFKTDKIFKKNELCFKLTKADVLLKICELLLARFFVFPQHLLKENNLDSWHEIIQKFDITVMGYNEDILGKVYSGLEYTLREKTKYSIQAFNKVTVNVDQVNHPVLKSHLFDYDHSSQALYFALWKSGLAPLVLKIDEENYLKLVYDVVTFLKSKHFPLKVIITTDIKLTHSYFPKELNVFFSLRNIKTLGEECLEKILNIEFEVLGSKTSLKEIYEYNKDFLEQLTPDALLNMYLNDFSFKDVAAPLTTDILEYTLVFNETDKIKEYFRRKDGCGRQRSCEKELTYMVNVQGTPTFIQVPPDL